MDQPINTDEEAIIRYLLGQLGAEAETRIEERYFTDTDYFEFLQTVEATLIDNYLAGTLSTTQKIAFEKNYLKAPRHREQLQFAIALLKKAEGQGETDKPRQAEVRPGSWFDVFRIKNIPVFFPLAVSFLLISVVALLLVQNLIDQPGQSEIAANSKPDQKTAGEPRDETANTKQQAPPETENPTPVLEPKNIPLDAKKSQATITLDQNSPITRGNGGLRRVEVKPETENLLIKLIFSSGEFRSFRVIVKDKSANEVANRENLKAQNNRLGKQLALKFLAQTFDDGEYFLTLIGVNENGKSDEIIEYAFRVIKN